MKLHEIKTEKDALTFAEEFLDILQTFPGTRHNQQILLAAVIMHLSAKNRNSPPSLPELIVFINSFPPIEELKQIPELRTWPEELIQSIISEIGVRTIIIPDLKTVATTARSNKVAEIIKAQDSSQHIRDYTKKEAKMIKNTIDSIISDKTNHNKRR